MRAADLEFYIAVGLAGIGVLLLLFCGCASSQPTLRVEYRPLANDVTITVELKP